MFLASEKQISGNIQVARKLKGVKLKSAKLKGMSEPLHRHITDIEKGRCGSIPGPALPT
jgi:hypothetical protein